MPKRLEIYVDQYTRELTLDANSPLRTAMFRFGWDEPTEIWDAMNATVPSLQCGRVRLVKADNTPIMAVEDHTDAAITAALRLFGSGRPLTQIIACGLEAERTGWKG